MPVDSLSTQPVVIFAIYEVFALILALPLSYALAIWMRRNSRNHWSNAVFERFQHHWNGKPEDEYYAWLKTKQDFQAEVRETKLINQKIRDLNRAKMLSDSFVADRGEVVSNGEK
mgnify:CR=1 FL=1